MSELGKLEKKKQVSEPIIETPKGKFDILDIEKVIDMYWEEIHQSKTPAMVELYNLKNYIKKNIKGE